MKQVRVLSLGAGVQSTTLYLMFMQGVLKPQLDAAIFADTQEEPEEVYRHLNWMRSLNGPPILTGTAGKLGDHLKTGTNTTGGRFASVPAFTMSATEKKGQTRRQCSREYKIDVIGKVLRRKILGIAPGRSPKGVKVEMNVGISLDEAGRARRLQLQPTPKYLTRHFPLIELFMTRAHCLDWLEKYGKVPHKVPRSACVFCPYHSDTEWLRIKNNAADWNRAVEIDEALRTPGNVVNRNMDAQMFLHRSCQPLTQIDFKTETPREQQSNFNFAPECLGVCGI